MKRHMISAAAAAMISLSAGAQAQTGSAGLVDHPTGQLREELEQRYSAALQATRAPDVIAATDSRYTWASEAKVECGIAIGFLKSGTHDPESVGRCDDAYGRMSNTPPALPVAVGAEAPLPPTGCAVGLPVSVYFDWDIDTPPADAGTLTSAIAAGMQSCGWGGLTVNGHADKSGTDAYNLRLSERRAQNVARLLEAGGVPAASITTRGYGESQPKINTAEGVREPMNRRVEIGATTTKL
jgi:outer membrane protein OmpA-like peptidoglycan-associated protein